MNALQLLLRQFLLHKPCMPFALPSYHCTSPSSPAGISVCTTQDCLLCQHAYIIILTNPHPTTTTTSAIKHNLNSLNYFQWYSDILQLILKGCNLLHTCHQLPPAVTHRRKGVKGMVDKTTITSYAQEVLLITINCMSNLSHKITFPG